MQETAISRPGDALVIGLHGTAKQPQ